MVFIKREEVLKETLVFLTKNSNTSQMAIQDYIEKNVLQRQEIKGLGGDGPLPPGVYIPEEARMYLINKEARDVVEGVLVMTNEVIWDLIIDRVLTPGRNDCRGGGLTLCVTDPKRLNARLSQLTSVH